MKLAPAALDTDTSPPPAIGPAWAESRGQGNVSGATGRFTDTLDSPPGIATRPLLNRAFLPAYLLAAGALIFSAWLLLDRPPPPPPPALPAAPASPGEHPGASEPPAPSPATNSAASTPPRPPRRLAAVAPVRSAAAEGPAAPSFRLSNAGAAIAGEVLEAHARLQAYDLEGARQLYEQAVGRNPQDTGSLLALAAIAGAQQRDDEARILRQRAFAADPGDPAVQAAMLGTPAGDGEPRLAESHLKSLLAHQAAPALEFVLGNLLARQQRWPEAQQAYFRAAAGDADNPDYLFNLAVSLEHLRQPAIAATYYRQALAASARRAASFDRQLAGQRAEALAIAGQP